MGKESDFFLQKWLAWLFGITTGFIISYLLFGFSTLEPIICIVIGYLLGKRIFKKKEPKAILL